MKKKINLNDRGLQSRLAIMVTEATKTKLFELKESSGAPVGEIVRRAIEQYEAN